MTKIAIIVGHNYRAQGAESVVSIWGHRSEFTLHLWTANHYLMPMLNQTEGILCKTFTRLPEADTKTEIQNVYRLVKEWGCDATVELHFNGGGGTGTETFCTTSKRSKLLAEYVQKSMTDAYRLPTRGVKPLLRSDRGGLNLYQLMVPSILTESFFGDSQNDCVRINEMGPRRYAYGIAKGIIEWARDAETQPKPIVGAGSRRDEALKQTQVLINTARGAVTSLVEFIAEIEKFRKELEK